ncbi:hypothetical protein M7I_7406 [Glarea lozoyensis 74030]|uniref:Uncharacterized protein n=1 Tax=Glarea lozoyensis (strain ATCC 74030 / MF5533) TaxID=1104152 RepID=H0EX79_GLAL7|nr:hypothetical protein M7I_7406 [Glarea lozoyensis 74030]
MEEPKKFAIHEAARDGKSMNTITFPVPIKSISQNRRLILWNHYLLQILNSHSKEMTMID